MFKNLFGSKDLSEIGKSGNSSKFADQFLRSDITLLSLPIPDSIDPANLTQDELLSLVKKAAKEISTQEQVNLFTYQEGNLYITPFFTDQPAVQAFAGYFAKKVRRVIPFEVISMRGASLAKYLSSETVMVLNPGSSSEYRLSEDDMASILRKAA